METSIKKPQGHLDVHTSLLMIMVAMLFDGVQVVLLFLNVLPILGTIVCVGISIMVWIYAWLTFKTWYASRGIDSHIFEKAAGKVLFVKGLKWVWILARIAEHVPLVGNFIPGITISTIAMNLVVYMNDHFERREWQQKLTRIEAFLWRRAMADASEYRNIHAAIQNILQDEQFSKEERARMAQKVRIAHLGKELEMRHSS